MQLHNRSFNLSIPCASNAYPALVMRGKESYENSTWSPIKGEVWLHSTWSRGNWFNFILIDLIVFMNFIASHANFLN